MKVTVSMGRLAQLVRALARQARGHRFESRVAQKIIRYGIAGRGLLSFFCKGESSGTGIIYINDSAMFLENDYHTLGYDRTNPRDSDDRFFDFRARALIWPSRMNHFPVFTNGTELHIPPIVRRSLPGESQLSRLINWRRGSLPPTRLPRSRPRHRLDRNHLVALSSRQMVRRSSTSLHY